jgi:hypothetical protein
MKHLSGIRSRLLVGLILLAIIAVTIPLALRAGAVGDRTFVTLLSTAGTATWTNPVKYGTIELKRLNVVSNLDATNVVTVSRIVADSAGTSYTQTVGAVTCVGGVGTQATLAYVHLKYGDKLGFSSLVATGGVAMVEYEQQEH